MLCKNEQENEKEKQKKPSFSWFPIFKNFIILTIWLSLNEIQCIGLWEFGKDVLKIQWGIGRE